MMKRYLLLLPLLAVFCFISKAQTKRALIIAIGNYPDPEKNGWMELSSLHDVPLIEAALASQHFKKENVWELLDEQATRQGIVNALDRLYDSCREGDIVVIHVSSHGE